MKLQAKGVNEIPNLMYVPKNKAFLDKIIMSSFHGAVDQLTQIVLADGSDKVDEWVLDNYVSLKKLRNQLMAELDEIDSMFDIVEARFGFE